jgi:hypothetical protein
MKRDSYEKNIRVALSTTHLIDVKPLYISGRSIKKKRKSDGFEDEIGQVI